MTKDKIRKSLSVIFLIILILGIAVFPFALDYAYGAGGLSDIPHNFKASDWFTFIGSYFPATFFGITALYQAHIIKIKDNELKKYRDKNRHYIKEKGKLYYYNKSTKYLGAYDRYQLLKTIGSESGDGSENFEKYFYFEFQILDKENIACRAFDVKSINWEIAGHNVLKENLRILYRYFERIRDGYLLRIFCEVLLEEDLSYIMQHVFNYLRNNSNYQHSCLKIELALLNDEDENWQLKMEFDLQCVDQICYVESINERISGKCL